MSLIFIGKFEILLYNTACRADILFKTTLIESDKAF